MLPPGVLVVLWIFELIAAAPAAQPPPASWAIHHSARVPPASPSTDADDCIKNFDYPRLAELVSSMAPSADRDYFAGVLANRQGQNDRSIRLLSTVLPQLRSVNAQRAAVALHTLADDDVKTFRYRAAITAYQELLHNFTAPLSKTEKQGAEDDYHAVLLLRNAAPQTVEFHGAVNLPTHRNPALGSIETNLTVNGVKRAWMLDTGANFSTVSDSFARQLGLTVSTEEAQTQGVTGAENKLHVAILPEMEIGGATLHNVVLLVLNDANLDVPVGKRKRYQINAVLGFPVMQALGRVTFTDRGRFLAGPDSPTGDDGARLFLNNLTPLLECRVDGRRVLFSFDTGANRTMLSDRFYREFPLLFSSLKKKPYAMVGAGGLVKMQVLYLPRLSLQVGSVRVVMKKVPTLPPLETDLDNYYGNLGRDFVSDYPRFTVDFEEMRFVLGGSGAH